MTPQRAQILGELSLQAKLHGVTVTEKGPGHFHLQGACLVNYYPFSKDRSAYVAGTPSVKHTTPQGAVLMALETPPDKPPPATYWTIFGRPCTEEEFRAFETPGGEGLPWDVKDSNSGKTGA